MFFIAFSLATRTDFWKKTYSFSERPRVPQVVFRWRNDGEYEVYQSVSVWIRTAEPTYDCRRPRSSTAS